MLDGVGGEGRRGEAREEFLQHVNFSLHLLHLRCFGSRVIRSQSLHLPKGLQGCVITLSPGVSPDSKLYTFCYSRTDVECIPSPFNLSILLPQDERLGTSGSIHRNTLIPPVVIQRVKSASVSVDSELISSIGKGLLVFAGIGQGDTEKDAENLVNKVLKAKFWPDENGSQVR